MLFGQLGAKDAPRAAYHELEGAPAFAAPITWSAIDPSAFDALILPGGHAHGMKQYLASEHLHEKVAAFARRDKPMGAICHGVLVLRARTPSEGVARHASRSTWSGSPTS